MKRILCVFSLLLILTACDDGDLTVDVIDFSEVAAQKCSVKDVIYKVKDGEMLFLEIPATTFTENETLENAPILVNINATNKVTYRKYNGTVTADNICPTVPDATPNLIEEWNATDGIIQITSTAIKTTNSTTGLETITGYKYYIELKNITFQKPSGPQVYEKFIFGNYSSTITPLAFGFGTEAAKSSCDNRVFNINGSQALVLEVGDFGTLFANAVTTTPRTALISTSNKLAYKLYTNAVNDTFFCTSPSTPLLSQEWNAVNGIEATSGIIQVETTTLGSGFLHSVHLLNVTLTKGNSEFSLGPDFDFGSFVTNP